MKKNFDVLRVFDWNGTNLMNLTQTILENELDSFENLTKKFKIISNLTLSGKTLNVYYDAGLAFGGLFEFYNSTTNPMSFFNYSVPSFFNGLLNVSSSIYTDVKENLLQLISPFDFNISRLSRIYDKMIQRPFQDPAKPANFSLNLSSYDAEPFNVSELYI